MRPIKFRVWNEKEGTMFKPFSLKKEMLKLGQWKKRIKLMQYIGLKDKNGNEIYEGDIIHRPAIFNIEKEETLIVKWGAWCYVDQKNRTIDKIKAQSRFKVIGNIFQNKSLLRKK